MTTKSSAYWRKRFETLEKAQLNKGIDTYHELEKQYTLATRAVEKEVLAWYSRYAKENKITLSEAKKLLAGRDLEAFRMDVKEYIKKGASLDPKWAKQLEQASVRVHVSRLEALKVHMQQQIERLHGHEVDALDKVARDIYTDGYYRTAFEVAKGSGVSATFAALDTNKIDKVISKPWANDGVEFSARIWKKRSTLVNDLHTLLTQNIIKGESPDKLIKLITKKFDVSKHQAGRLIMTESAYFSSVAQHDSFKDVGVERYEIVATLDDRTSDICQEMDGKVFKMSEWEVGVTAPVFHANCRTTTVPYFADLGGERASRDSKGKYKTVPADMTYKDWKDKFVESVADNVVATAVVSKVFAPAENLDEVKQRMVSALGNDTIDLKKMDLNLANEYLAGIETFTNEYPMIKGFVKDINTKVVSPRAYANISLGWKTSKDDLVKITESKLCLRNPKDYAALTGKMANDIKTGFHYEGSSFKSTAAHELTHSLEYMIGAISKGSYVGGKFVEVAGERPFNTFAYQIIEQAKKDVFGKTVGREVYDGMKYLGSYAFTSAQETLAEAISYELTVGTNPFSAKVKELFDLKIKEVLK